jgi:hypothetical protein
MKTEMQQLIIEKILNQFRNGIKGGLLRRMHPNATLYPSNTKFTKRKEDNATIVYYDIMTTENDVVGRDYVVIQ